MSRYEVYVSLEAETDLQGIKEYIENELKNPETAKSIISKMKNNILSLETMPYRFNLVADGRLAASGIRKIMVGNYLIFYNTSEQEKTVNIVRVLYAGRDWENII
jgi:toxin ParE1/3/4